jgi:hypothetical protein
MQAKDDLQTRWWALEAKLVERFGKKPDLETILFLIGVQEFGQVKEKFTKEQKQDLCILPFVVFLRKAAITNWKERMLTAGRIFVSSNPYRHFQQ